MSWPSAVGFQAYFPQKRDGSVRVWEMDVMAQVAEFCRERQDICHRAESVPQVGLLYSRDAYYRKSTRLFAPWHGELEPLRGTLQALLDGQHVVDIVSEHHLKDDIDVPADRGAGVGLPGSCIPRRPVDLCRGRWFAAAESAPRLWRSSAMSQVWRSKESPRRSRASGWPLVATSPGSATPSHSQCAWQALALWAACISTTIPIGASEVAASIVDYGKGQIGAVHVDLGERYLHGASFVVRDFLTALVRELMPDPMVTVTGSHYVDVTLTRQEVPWSSTWSTPPARTPTATSTPSTRSHRSVRWTSPFGLRPNQGASGWRLRVLIWRIPMTKAWYT